MRLLPVLLILAAMLTPAHALVEISEQGRFIKLKEVDGGSTLQLLYLRKADVSAVTYTKTGFNEGVVTVVMHYRDNLADNGGFTTYRIGVPPNKDGEDIADRIIRLTEPERDGHVIKREVIMPKP